MHLPRKRKTHSQKDRRTLGEVGDSKHGPAEEAVDGEKADSRGDDPTVPAAPASHPPKQCEYQKS